MLAQVVLGIGHDVVAREVDVSQVAAATAAERPDVALVALGISSDHALDLITEIVHEAHSPVIAIIDAAGPTYVRDAAKRGVFAYIIDGNPRQDDELMRTRMEKAFGGPLS